MSPALHVHTRQEQAPPRVSGRPSQKERPLVLGSLVASAPAAVNWECVRRPAKGR